MGGRRSGLESRRAGRRQLLSPRASRARAVRAGQAGRRAPARARPRARGQARVERGDVRAVPRSARGDRAVRQGAEPVPRRRGVPPAHGSRRKTRRSFRGGRARLGSGRRRRLPLPGAARSGRRDRLRLAVVLELSHRRAEDGRRAEARAAPGSPLRPRGHRGRGRPAHEDRLPLSPQQPDRHVERPLRARRVLRRRAGSRAHRRRPGVLRVRRRPRVLRRDRHVLQATGETSSACGRSRRSTGWRVCASGTGWGRRRSCASSARCAARST